MNYSKTYIFNRLNKIKWRVAMIMQNNHYFNDLIYIHDIIIHPLPLLSFFSWGSMDKISLL